MKCSFNILVNVFHLVNIINLAAKQAVQKGWAPRLVLDGAQGTKSSDLILHVIKSTVFTEEITIHESKQQNLY